MDILIIFCQLFWTFFVIGLFTFGGGYAMLSLIQAQVVGAHGWLTESGFANIVAVSQMTPGPIGINSATYVGYEVAMSASGSHFVGVLGSFTATLALVLPSFMIVLALVKFYTRFKGSAMFEDTMKGLRPAVCGLIGAAAVILTVHTTWSGTPLLSKPEMSIVRDNFIDFKSWIIFAAALAASFLFKKLSPILLILLSALAGLLLY